MKKENIDKYLLKYNELNEKYKDNPELAGAFKEILGYLTNSKVLRDTQTEEQTKMLQELSDSRLIKQIVLHELRTPIHNIKGFTSLLRISGEEIPFEQKLEYYDIFEKEADKIQNIADILYLNGCSREELNKNPEFFSLENMLKNYGHTINPELIKEKVGLGIRCERPYNKDLELFANKPVFEIILGTLTGNSINYAPQDTTILQGARINKAGNLEIVIENKHDRNIQKRKFSGLGKGLGLKFTKEVIKNLGGKINVYDETRIKDDYDANYKFGIKEKKEKEGYQTFGVQMIIPPILTKE